MGKTDIPLHIKERLDKVDPERLEGYMNMFDRILLYSLAANTMPQHAIKDVIGFWEQTVKKTINMDCQRFTQFLQSTPQGRLSSLAREQPDGEDMRLRFLETFNLAHEIISTNITHQEDTEEFDS